MARGPSSLLAMALAGALAAAAAGCGGASRASTPAALKLQREDLIAVSHALRALQVPIAREVAATKAAWPAIANGLPAQVATLSHSPQVRAATDIAARLRLPALLGEAQVRRLTGPAAQIAGLLRAYTLLNARSWRLLNASVAQIQTASAANARFARANAPLYIESIYDAHFALAQIGRKLLAGYQKLGAASAFGAALTQAEVDALARIYSEASDRLHPHAGVQLGS
jgi:hypothetical protein